MYPEVYPWGLSSLHHVEKGDCMTDDWKWTVHTRINKHLRYRPFFNIKMWNFHALAVSSTQTFILILTHLISIFYTGFYQNENSQGFIRMKIHLCWWLLWLESTLWPNTCYLMLKIPGRSSCIIGHKVEFSSQITSSFYLQFSTAKLVAHHWFPCSCS